MAISGGFESLSGINDPNQTTPSYQSAGGYSWQPNGSGGVDYFMLVDNGTSSKRVPITNTEYQRGTGENTNAIEQQASQDFGTSTNINGLLNTVGSGTTSTSGIGSGSGTTADIVSYNGVDYDLNNATDRQAFYQLKSSEIDKQLTQALSAGNMKYAGDLAKAQDQMTQYMKDWNTQGQDLLSGYSSGVTNRQQFFQGLGARSFQSSMGESGKNALNQLGQAQTERNYQKTQAQNQNTQGISGLEQSYNDWISGAGQQAQTAKDTLKQTNANIAGFKGASVAPIAGQADLSQFTPTTTFQQLQGSPMVGQQSTAPKPVSQMTLSEWLQQNQTKSANPLQDYMMGKA